jgi:hypothetical protein
LKPSSNLLLLLTTFFISIITSFTVTTLSRQEEPAADPADQGIRNMLDKYRVMREFLDLPLPETEEELEETGQPLVDDLLKLQKASRYMKEKKYRLMAAALRGLASGHPFIQHQRDKLQLRTLYFNRDYRGFIRMYPQTPPHTLTLQLLLMNSYLKTGEQEKAESLFRTLFARNNLKPFLTYLSRSTLNGFLKRLDYDYWFEKFKFLAGRNRFSEFLREKQYAGAPQLTDLFYAEFYYRRRQYSRCKKRLAQVKSPDLLTYKQRMVLKMELRDDMFGNLDGILEEVKNDTAIYLELLLDSAGILLNKGEKDLALEMFSRYTGTVRRFHFELAAVLGPDAGVIRDMNYWKSLWISAWLHYRSDNKDKAEDLFKDSIHSPISSYRAASRYWLQRLDKRAARKLNIDTGEFPFTYYYTLTHPQPMAGTGSLEPLVRLLNHPSGPGFEAITEDIKTLARYGLTVEAGNLIQWTIRHKNLNSSDKHTLMLIESILYLKKGNYAMAFIRYRDNFECYRCLRLPVFLREIALPVKYPALVEQYCELEDLDPQLVYSLIREESYFRPGAVSYANANGLMQLLLRTARQMEGRGGRRLYRRHLFQPETNIRLGTKYLRFLLDKYDDRLHLALAAYNAGDHRVDTWLARFGEVRGDEFIEMIPFTATRSYVKNILRNYYYYRFYYGANGASM